MKIDDSINPNRLLSRIAEMADIGRLDNGGVCRLALDKNDLKARALFESWSRNAGCKMRIDGIGNQFARKEGSDPRSPAVLIGSHLDTQPSGGRYDGVLGVLAGLEVVERLREESIEHTHPVEVVNWTNEEGARFRPAMLGSGVFAGEFGLEFALSQSDSSGATVRNELKKLRNISSGPIEKPQYKACFELHIEQGPILENNGIPIGVVTGVQGIRWLRVNISGEEAHAGPVPMELRKDPVRKLPALLSSMYDIAGDYSPDSRVTVGDIETLPGSINTVPGSVNFTIDIRHPDEDTINKMHERIATEINSCKLPASLEQIWYSPPVKFDSGCIAAIKKSAEKLHIQSMPIISGAGHDSVYVSRVAPTGMIFIPCKDGISHNEAEYAYPDDIAAGASVLYETVKSVIGIKS